MIHAPTDSELSELFCPDETALDLDLIRKYAVAGPRYTSYPPATVFTPAFDDADAQRAIALDNDTTVPGAAPDAPLSVYIHLPFCEALCWYCGCNNIITRDHSAADAYLDHLATEIALTAARIRPDRLVTQLHLGGGTPTFLSPTQLRRLGRIVRDHFTFHPHAEIGVEIDPRHLTAAQVEALVELGLNRASLGVQDTNPAVQLAIHRIQPHATNVAAVALLRAAGVHSISFDLIYGLPLQTADSFSRTLDDVLSLAPSRLSLFSYAHIPWLKPAQQIFEKLQQLPAPEAKLALFALARHRLTAAGYVDIGLDHFALPDDELTVAQRNGTLHRNFQGYSTHRGASLYAFGLSAISSTPGSYRQNVKTLDAYRDALAAGRLPIERGLILTPEDQRRRTLIMRLMCDRRLDYTALSRELGIDFPSTYARELASLADLIADGIVQTDAHGLFITPRGLPLVRVVAMRFDEYLSTQPRRHSLAV
ncbi:MAG: oxygen-independent coproporphyrinogen III oxidase [Rariglobus sp.]